MPISVTRLDSDILLFLLGILKWEKSSIIIKINNINNRNKEYKQSKRNINMNKYHNFHPIILCLCRDFQKKTVSKTTCLCTAFQQSYLYWCTAFQQSYLFWIQLSMKHTCQCTAFQKSYLCWYTAFHETYIVSNLSLSRFPGIIPVLISVMEIRIRRIRIRRILGLF